MTIAFCAASPKLLVMTVDSAITLDFGQTQEYTTSRKSYFYKGVGGVTTWGARDHNRVGAFLEQRNISADSHTVSDLADLVQTYLTEEYRPHEIGLDEVGYHVAGYDRTGRIRVFHIFWGFDRPRSPDQLCPEYRRYDHSPEEGTYLFLYNGRNDLAEILVRTMIEQVKMGKVTRVNIRTEFGLCWFGDFVARFAAELTPEVGPPFVTHLISPQNFALTLVNRSYAPIMPDTIQAKLRELDVIT